GLAAHRLLLRDSLAADGLAARRLLLRDSLAASGLLRRRLPARCLTTGGLACASAHRHRLSAGLFGAAVLGAHLRDSLFSGCLRAACAARFHARRPGTTMFEAAAGLRRTIDPVVPIQVSDQWT